MADGPLRILLVEDNPGDARLLRETLRDADGFACALTHAQRLDQALQCLASQELDVALLDLSLPDSDGAATVQRLIAAAPNLPVVVLTGTDDAAVGTSAVRCGAQDYLVKGQADHRLLIRAIHYAIERKHAEEALRQLNARLEQRVDERTRELAASNAGLRAQMDAYQRLEAEVAHLVEDERLHLGMELHDNLCQQLAAAAMQTTTLARRLRDLDAPLAESAARIAATLSQAGDDAQAMARGLLPVQIQADGLMTSLAGLAHHTRESAAVACVFECAAPVLLRSNVIATHLFRIAQEAVHNALKHGQARRIVLSLAASERVTLTIADDGVGIPPEGERTPGGGLRIMAYRARIIGAELRVDPAPAGGTLVQCVLNLGARP